MFSAYDYAEISEVAFQYTYPGYMSNIPTRHSSRTPVQYDAKTRYAHLSLRYLEEYPSLHKYIKTANNRAIEVASKLKIPKAYFPVEKYGVIRILEYPAGAVSPPHTDFDLFTLMCYRNNTASLKYLDKSEPDIMYGELLAVILPEYKATKHQVLPDSETQQSIVYFTMPDHNAVLPNRMSVRNWCSKRPWSVIASSI